MPMMNKTATIETKLLKAMLATYILLAFILAGLNFGYADQAPVHIASFIKASWHFYENELKTAFIVIGGFLTLRLAGISGRTKMRRNNIIGFTCAALVIHIIGPYLLNYPDLYFFAMPLPWTNQPLQLLVPGSDFYLSFLKSPGINALRAVLAIYFSITLVVFIGTISKGRRWQCSTICLFSGFVSEVFAPVFPLIGKKKKASPGLIKFFMVLRWVFFCIAILLSGFWLLQVAGLHLPGNLTVITQFEIYKYLLFDLIAALLIWAFFTGRGYCYYCPLGTVVGLLGRAAGQRIATNLTECIKCGKCNQACPMAIDILSCAREGKPVIDLNCVGCGHCVDICPKQTLAYVTGINRSGKQL
jgi:ferredoxin-type protein NapH